MALKDEQIIHINTVNWFKETWPDLKDDIHHFANERKCSFQEGRILKRMSVTPGVLDLFLGVPTFQYHRTKYHGLWLELKTEKGKLTNEQIKFMDQKNKRGYFAICAWGFESAKKIIVTYLSDCDFYKDWD